MDTCQLPRILFLMTVTFTLRTASDAATNQESDSPKKPNIILILADDLGYGDVQVLNHRSSIPTPNINRLAKEGMTFTDAHSPSAVCTPTRYGLLTGRYCWRTTLKRGVLNGYGKPLIETDRATLGTLLKAAGYRTHVVGKWHLGLGIPGGDEKPDFTQSLTFHPGDVGFDHSFVIPASLDFPPYFYFKNGNATEPESIQQAAIGFPAYTRAGPRAKDFSMRNCLDRLTDETLAIIDRINDQTDPSFIYFPLTAPHKPVLPNALFTGSTQFGPYGDFLRQVDHTIGRVIASLEKNNQLDNTLIILTSDNGSFMRKTPADEPDHLDDVTVQGFHSDSHLANAEWRGTKADIWEAGHRVPFFIRLPNAEHAGIRLTQTIGLVDIFATLTDWLGLEGPDNSAPDSYSFAPLLRDPRSLFDRPPLICHSAAGMFAIRDGQWKLIAGNGSGGREQPRGKPFAEPWILINLDADPAETTNVADMHPEITTKLKAELVRIKGND